MPANGKLQPRIDFGLSEYIDFAENARARSANVAARARFVSRHIKKQKEPFKVSALSGSRSAARGPDRSNGPKPERIGMDRFVLEGQAPTRKGHHGKAICSQTLSWPRIRAGPPKVDHAS